MPPGIDLVLEQDRGLAKQVTDPVFQMAIAKQRVEARVVRTQILDPLHEACAGMYEAFLVIHHVGSGHLAAPEDFVRESNEFTDLR